MSHVIGDHCARPDLMGMAMQIAHRHTPRCTGDRWQGDDGVRYHCKKCEALAADIYIALIVCEKK